MSISKSDWFDGITKLLTEDKQMKTMFKDMEKLEKEMTALIKQMEALKKPKNSN
ncbi:hypothetical protein [Paenibacillus elgii]|uniref:hypothetical protein n=1 Tax=Paenibacillus elgii TaxID=189691 RepID=UPI00203D93FC|nr:hypothetical protein [Paenibacillus elgii]MCM3270779.1 hypothetical protein [Paenibacillus elgii]